MEIAVLLGLLVSSGIAVWLFQTRGQRRLPDDRVDIATAESGPRVSVRGRVEADDDALEAPYSGRRCVYYRLELTQTTMAEAIDHVVSQGCDFEIADDTGIARVMVDDASVFVVSDPFELERVADLSDHAREIVERCGWRLKNLGQVEIREAVIAIGDEVDVIGAATREPLMRPGSGERGYRDAPATVLVFSSAVEIYGEEREAVYRGS